MLTFHLFVADHIHLYNVIRILISLNDIMLHTDYIQEVQRSNYFTLPKKRLSLSTMAKLRQRFMVPDGGICYDRISVPLCSGFYVVVK